MIEVDGIETAIRDTGYRSSYAEGVADVYIACLEAATRPEFDKAAAQAYFENRGKLILNAKMITRLLHAKASPTVLTSLTEVYESVLEQLDAVIESLGTEIKSNWGTVSVCPVEPEGYPAKLAYADYTQRLQAHWTEINPSTEHRIA